MSLSVGFTRLKTHCVIGTLPHERLNPQTLWLSLYVTASDSLPFEREEITSTIDYSLLANLCQEIAQSQPRLLLETLAHDILVVLFARFPLQYVKLKIEKSAALDSAECAFVELERTRS